MSTTRAAVLILALAAGLAACGDSPLPAEPVTAGPAGEWRLQSFDAVTVPGTYAEFFDEPVGEGRLAHVVIRIDSAGMRLGTTATYQRFYCFSELHDAVLAFRYCWGDHGVYSLNGAALTLVSEYIQHLTAAGTVTGADRIALSEPLWLGEDPRNTVWRRPGS